MLAVQLGESANEAVAAWGKRGYRYGFPDFYAAQFPVRPMYYDQSRIYSGVIGRHYPDAKTARYHHMFDPNMYQQPGNYDPNPFPTRGFGQVDPVAAATAPTTQAAVQTPSSGAARAGRVAIGAGITAILIGAGIFISSRSRRHSHR